MQYESVSQEEESREKKRVQKEKEERLQLVASRVWPSRKVDYQFPGIWLRRLSAAGDVLGAVGRGGGGVKMMEDGGVLVVVGVKVMEGGGVLVVGAWTGKLRRWRVG